MSAICTKVLLKLAMGTKVFLKLSHASTLAIWIEEIQAKLNKNKSACKRVDAGFDKYPVKNPLSLTSKSAN